MSSCASCRVLRRRERAAAAGRASPYSRRAARLTHCCDDVEPGRMARMDVAATSPHFRPPGGVCGLGRHIQWGESSAAAGCHCVGAGPGTFGLIERLHDTSIFSARWAAVMPKTQQFVASWALKAPPSGLAPTRRPSSLRNSSMPGAFFDLRHVPAHAFRRQPRGLTAGRRRVPKATQGDVTPLHCQSLGRPAVLRRICVARA